MSYLYRKFDFSTDDYYIITLLKPISDKRWEKKCYKMTN